MSFQVLYKYGQMRIRQVFGETHHEFILFRNINILVFDSQKL